MPTAWPTVKVVANATNTTLTTTAETIVATLPNVNTQDNARRVKLHGRAVVITGTGTTSVELRIRRGATLTDPLVGESSDITVGAAAGSTEEFTFDTEDTPGEVASQTYVLTADQTGATGNGTCVNAYLEAVVT